MKASNRLEDVFKLVNQSSQDFVKLVIKGNWQNQIYLKAEDEVKNNGKYRDKYILVYNYMRDYGVLSYTVEHMDITFISELVHGCRNIIPTKKETLKAIERLVEDRNVKGHLSGNEDEDELYLIGLLTLVNLKKFIKIVDNHEIVIDEQLRLSFRQKYVKAIDDLKDILDEERIELVQISKGIKKDVEKILESENQLATWLDIYELYDKRYNRLEDKKIFFEQFVIACSDLGVQPAHKHACGIFAYKKDIIEFEKRIHMLFNSYDYLATHNIKSILAEINDFIMFGNVVTPIIEEVIQKAKLKGFKIERNDNGFFKLIN